MASSGWLGQRGGGGGLCVGSGVSELGRKEDMEKDKVLVARDWPSFWGAEEVDSSPPTKFLVARDWPSLWGAEEVDSSPPTLAESPVASAESEEGEECEDYVCDLAEQIAQSMLEEDEESSVNSVPWLIRGPKPACSAQASLPSSPQSTLAGIGCCNWDLSRPASSGGLSSGVSSPPTPVAATEVGEDDALDLLYAELLRLNMEDEIKVSKQQQFQLLQQQLLLKMKQSPNLVSSDGYVKGRGSCLHPARSPTHNNKGSSTTGSSVRSRSKNEEQIQQFRARKQVGACWGGPPPQQHHQSSNGSDHGNKRRFGANALDITQSHHRHFPFNSSQQQAMNGSGMRAVFLGTPGSREVGGTGVFLPRRMGSGPDTKRKPVCSTVLLPSRIVHALNLNVEDTLGCPIPLPTTTARKDYASATPTWRQDSPIPTKRSDSRETASYSPLQEVTPDISLPTEWTY